MKVSDELLVAAIKKVVDLELLPKWGDMETAVGIVAQNAYNAGRTSALADAVAAVKNNVVRFSIEINGEWLISQKVAIAAIEALEGK